MKTAPFYTSLILIALTVPAFASPSGPRQYIVLSSRVGPVIDSLEASQYRLFQWMPGFRSAAVFQAADSTAWVEARFSPEEGQLCDTVFAISEKMMQSYAERINHSEEIMQGGYRIGTDPPELVYEDGTPVQAIRARVDTTKPSKRTLLASSNQARTVPRSSYESAIGRPLRLAPNPGGLKRPRFESVTLAVSAGWMQSDLSKLEGAAAVEFRSPVTLSAFLHVPILHEPSIALVSGWGFHLGEDFTTFSAAGIMRTPSIYFIRPMIGAGIAHSAFHYQGSVIIDASETYPFLLFGVALIEDAADLVCTVPLGGTLSTPFEERIYTIRPFGIGIGLMVTL
ncbi:MAG: hypothetical protein ACM3Q4_08985 [Acidobacteriota bacterium]